MLHHRIGSALSEGSSWAAIAAVLGTLATQVPPHYSAVTYTACAGAAIIGILLKDKGPA